MRAARFRLDFAAAAHGRSRLMAWLALVLCAVLAAIAADRYAEETELVDALQARHDRLQERLRPSRQRAPTAAPADAEVVRQIQSTNRIIDELALPWNELFEAVEAADMPGLGLLEMTPNAQDRTLRLSGEVRAMADLLKYLERLSAQPRLGRVHLLGYETVARGGVNVIAFSIAARWVQA